MQVHVYQIHRCEAFSEIDLIKDFIVLKLIKNNLHVY